MGVETNAIYYSCANSSACSFEEVTLIQWGNNNFHTECTTPLNETSINLVCMGAKAKYTLETMQSIFSYEKTKKSPTGNGSLFNFDSFSFLKGEQSKDSLIADTEIMDYFQLESTSQASGLLELYNTTIDLILFANVSQDKGDLALLDANLMAQYLIAPLYMRINQISQFILLNITSMALENMLNECNCTCLFPLECKLYLSS